jgi:hypothetical protein
MNVLLKLFGYQINIIVDIKINLIQRRSNVLILKPLLKIDLAKKVTKDSSNNAFYHRMLKYLQNERSLQGI